MKLKNNTKETKAMTIDKDKEYTTQSGLEVRVDATDGGGERPVHGAVYYDGEWRVCSWREGGRHLLSSDSEWDLVEKAPTVVKWFNVYPDFVSEAHDTQESADWCSGADRLYCKRVEFPLCGGGET